MTTTQDKQKYLLEKGYVCRAHSEACCQNIKTKTI